MDHILPEFMERGLGVLVFILAMTLLMTTSGQQSKFVKIIKAELKDKKEIYIQNQDEAYENNNSVPYKEVIGILLSDNLEYNVEVNGQIYSREDHHYQNVNVQAIPKKTYKKSYVYTTNGTIMKVIYQAN